MNRFVVAVALVVATQAPALADVTKLFSKIGMPKVAGKRWVVFETGDSTVSGWLLDAFPDEVVLLTRALVHRRLPRKRPSPPGELRDGDFDAVCKDLLAGRVERSAYDAREGGLAPVAEAALFAHWQRQRGNEELARKLLALVEGSADHEAEVVKALALNLRWQAIQFATEGMKRDELVDRWRAIEELPEHPWTAEARSTCIDYEVQLSHDRAYRVTPDELAKLEPGERARFLCRLLRNHDGRKAGPKEELAKIGWDAIPYLLEGLANARPTRALRQGQAGVPESFQLVTTSECCRQVFEEVTGERLPEDRREAVDAAQDWWSSAHEKGERAFLVEGVEKGDAAAAARAARLQRLYPGDALPAIRKGIASSKDERARANLVAVVASVPGDEALSLLEDEAKEDRPLGVRIAAARGLVGRGRRDAARAFVPVWEKAAAEESDRALIGLLAGAGDPGCVRALAKELAKRGLAARRDVISAFADEDALRSIGSERPKDWDAAVDELLASELTDTGEIDGKKLGDLAARVRELRRRGR